MTLSRLGTAAAAPRRLFVPLLACTLFTVGIPLSAGALPVDPQVQTVSFHPFQSIWSPESHVFQSIESSATINQLIRVTLSVDGSAASLVTRQTPTGFISLSGIKGLIFGYLNDPESSSLQEFRIIDELTSEVVASLPAQGWFLADDRLLAGDEYLGMIRGGVPQPLLVRFNAVTRSITTLPLPGLPQGMGRNTLVGAGQGWLAFYRSWLNEEEKLLFVNPETGELMSHVRMGRDTFPVFDGLRAAGADHQFLKIGPQVRAINVRDGSIKNVGAGSAEVIQQPRAIAASGQDLWIYGNSTTVAFSPMELQRWSLDATGEWRLTFRGIPSRPGGFNSSSYVKLVPSGEGVLVQHDGKVDYFLPRLARPILRLPQGVVLKDGGGSQKFNLELDRASSHPVSVRVRTAGGTATGGADYVSFDKQVIFPAGATKVSMDLDVLSDLLPESNETVVLEFSQPLGLSLPPIRMGSLMIEASGPELTEIPLSSGGGPSVIPHSMISRGKDVTVGVASIPASAAPAVYLWDSRTGALRGKTSLPVPDPNNPAHRVMETAAGMDISYLEEGKLVICRINPSNGATLASSSFTLPQGYPAIAMMGGGRVFLASTGQSGTGGTYFAKIYEIGGAPEGQSFAIPPMQGGGGFPVVCDGKHLAIAWRKESLSGEASPAFVRVYPLADLSTSWELDTTAYSFLELRAIRGDMLLARGNVGAMGIDLSLREVVWRASAQSIGPVGDEIWYDGDSYDPSAYDIFTGLKIEGGERVADSFGSETQLSVDGPGGILFRDYDTYPVAGEQNPALRFRLRQPSNRRTRPGIQMLNQAMEEAHDGAYLTFRALESTASPVQVSARHVDSEIGLFAKLTFAPTPVTVPADGKPAGLHYHVQPSISIDPYQRDYRLNISVSSPSSVPSSGVHSLPFTSGIPRAYSHLGTVIPGPSAPGEQPYVSMRACDGRLVAWTGFAHGLIPSNPPNHRVDVIDPATGSLVRRIVDPSPNIYKRFGINAILQGNKLLVISRELGGEEGLAEIFDINTGNRLGMITYTGNLPEFGDVVASNETYFAIAIPGMGLGKPAGSEVSVYRWSDLSRVTRKTAGNSVRFGSGIVLRGNVLYVSSLGPSADPSKGKIQSFALPGGTAGAVPAGVSGVLGSTSEHLFVARENLQLYRWSGMQAAWSVPLKNYFSYPEYVSTGGGYVVVRDDRDVNLLSETTGAPVATTRFSDANTGLYGGLTGAAVMNGSVFTLTDGVLMKTPLKALGDFAAWRRFDGLTLEQAPPSEDRDGNGVADFDDYVASRLNPAAPFAAAAHLNGKVRLSSSVMPPPDVLVLAEVEASPGAWTVLAWRDGRNPWQPGTPSAQDGSLLVDLPAGTSPASALRLRYLPHAGLGAGSSIPEWPPSMRVPETGGVNPISASGDEDGDGLPNWLELQAKMGNGAPLALTSGNGQAGVSLLRPKGQVTGAILETSADLKSWHPATEDPNVEVRIVPEDDQFERVTIRGKAGVTQRYFRLKY